MYMKNTIGIFIRHFWIVFLLPCYNVLEWIFVGKGIIYIHIESVYVISLVLAAFIEEFIFRKWLFGILLHIMQLKLPLSILVTNAVFATYHLCNIFSYASLTYGIIQSIVAFSFGIAMSTIYRERNNLTICILAHLLVNLSSILNAATDIFGKYILQDYQVIALCIISCVYLFYSFRSFKNVN